MPDLRHRLGVIAIVTTCLFAGLFARLGFLQLVEKDQLQKEAEGNLRRTVVVPSTRGRILDRYGDVLVDNQLVSVVTIDRQKFPKREAQRAALFERLGSVLEVPAADIRRKFDTTDSLLPIEVARAVRESAVVYLGEHLEEFPGVAAKLDAQRVYPRGTLAAHVLGYIGDVGDDLKAPPCNARYQTGDKVGKAGVERSFECVLRGMPGVTEFTVDRRNRVLEERVLAPPVPGVDIRLTIDPKIQELAETSLVQGLKAARQEVGYVFTKEKKLGFQPLKAPAGSVVVEDSRDGSVLAMASYPDYDPRDFIRGISNKEFEARYGEQAESPLTNRAITGRYPPGSTFKLFTAVSALKDGLIQEFSTIEDTGVFLIPGCDNSKKQIKCAWKNSGSVAHGKVDVRKSLTVSSDVFYYRLGYRFWNDAGVPREGIQEVAREFGLNEDTAVQLPYEKQSNVPDQAQKRSRHDAKPNIWPDGDWRTGDNLNLSIGQGETLVTPLGLTTAYGAFANGGNLYVPRIAFDTPAPPSPVTTLEPTSTVGTSTSTSTPRLTASAGASAPSTSGTGASSGSSGTSTSAAPTPSATTSTMLTSFVPTTSTIPASTTTVAPPAVSTTTSTTVLGSTTSTTLTPLDGPPSTAARGGRAALPEAHLTPILRRRIDLPAAAWQPVVDGLTGVVAQPSGTASDAFAGFPLDRFPIAGKTGTAQSVGKQDNALFAAFGGPDRRFVVSVVMEQAGFGGQAAAPVARRIFNGLAGEPLGVVTYVRAPTAQDR